MAGIIAKAGLFILFLITVSRMMATSIRVLYDFLVYADISAVFLVQGKMLYQSALQNTSRLILPSRLKFMNLVALVDCQQNQLNVSAVFCAYCSINYS